MKLIKTLNTERLILGCIVIAAFFLRVYHLGYQSFWLDELHTAIESGTTTSWHGLFDYLHDSDQHPLLFFALEKILFQLFGSNEIVARSLSVIAGTISVWAIYLLAKELYSGRAGLIAAVFTCINIFNISYSQEARPYALVSLFTILSFLFLVRFIKTLSRKNSILYAIFTLLMIYSHYFGLFVLASQIIIGIIFWILEDNKKKFLSHFLLSGLIIAICYAPWLPFLNAVSSIKSFWIPKVPSNFPVLFFFEYFGDSHSLKHFLLLLLLLCAVCLFIGIRKEKGKIKERPLTFAFLICTFWILVTVGIPYLRSIFIIPMLITRYTIVVLPAIIILLALGIEFTGNNVVRYAVVVCFLWLSFSNIFHVKKYYTQVSKTQFRELAKFMASDTSVIYPVVTDITSWHQPYYLNKFSYHTVILSGKEESTIDSIIHKSSEPYNLSGFWITGAHGEKQLSKEVCARLDTSFVLVKKHDFFDAWARLYVLRTPK